MGDSGCGEEKRKIWNGREVRDDGGVIRVLEF